jgi:hypothetical protein
MHTINLQVYNLSGNLVVEDITIDINFSPQGSSNGDLDCNFFPWDILGMEVRVARGCCCGMIVEGGLGH